MRKVLLADDEFFIRKGLKALIERSESTFTVIEECDNGKSALEMLKNDRFDLAIIDIRMPHIDGITLLKEIYRFEYKPQIIILSGYDDFNYAREAIKYGARDYLLKPVDRMELMNSLEKVEEELAKMENINADKTRIDNLFSQLYANELNYILLNNNLPVESTEGILDKIKLDVLNGSYRIALMGALINECRDHGNFNLSHVKCAEEYLKKNGIDGMFFPDKDGNIVMITEGSQNDCKALADYMNEKYAHEFFIGVSGEGKDAGNFRKVYMQAREALKYKIIRNKQYILFYDDIDYSDDWTVLHQETIKKLAEVLGTDRFDEIGRAIHQIFDNRNFSDKSFDYFEKTIDSVNKYLIDSFSKYIPSDKSSLAADCEYVKNPDNFLSLQDYVFSLKNLLIQINDYLTELKKEYKEKNAVDIAIAWLRENYHKGDMTMSMVANQVSLNYSYFSMAFKEHTGMSFVSYLKKIRIEKAKELLRNTEDKINEVARKVGFQSPRLFTKSFKEEVGISPLEYSRKPIHTDDL